MKQKRCVMLMLGLALVAPAARADVIHLKNGSVLKGKVASFADEQFIVLLDTGTGRSMSRAMVYAGDVARIEFEGPAATRARPSILLETPAVVLPTLNSAFRLLARPK